jgi:diguanylate cyclase (GGDEF)-like protein/PAS domain S-box-containing protein
MKISTRLLLLFLVVAVLPLALFSYFDLQQNEATLREAALDMMSGLADKKVIQVESYLTERVRDVHSLAGGESAQQGMPALSRAYAEHHPDSAEYRRVARQFDQDFAGLIEEGSLFHDVFLITPQGEIVYTYKHEADFATNLLNGLYLDSPLAEAFRESRMMLESSISGFETYAPSNQPAAFVTAPIIRDGVFIGVVALQLKIAKIYEVAGDQVGLGQSGETVLSRRIDQQHVMYIAPLKREVELGLFKPRDFGKVPIIMRQALSGTKGSGIANDYRGIQVVAAWRYLPGLDWGMVVKIDTAEVFSPIYRQRAIMLEVLLGLLLFSGLVAYHFGRQISTPLDGLAQTAGEVANGDLSKRADESAPGELGLFARAFNHMTERLQGLYRTLEDRIEERTRELNVTNEQLQEEIIERTQIEKNLLDANDELERNQIFLNEAQRLGQLGSWELNLVSGELHWSDEVYRLFELDPAQFSPSYENFLNAIHPDDRDKVNKAYTESLRNRQPYDVEHRLLMADGRIKWVREHCSSEFDAADQPLRSVGAVQDITEQKLAHDDLRVAATTFETHEGIVITDARSNILRVNRTFQEITGYSADEVLGKNPRILSSGRQSKEFYAEMWRQLLEEGSWSGEIWDRRKNGEIYPKWLTISAVKDEQGNVTEYVAIFSDITARKRAEEEIRNLAFFDTLTGLPNRRLLLDRFQLALSLSSRSHHCGALLFLDMDKFKTLNDTQGHDYGDLMLIEVGRRIQACVREVDTVARLGGDEFVVLFEEISANMEDASQKAALIAEKIRIALAEPYVLREHEFHSSPSIGVSMYRGNTVSVDVLMKHADMAMYQAKDAGRNAVRFFDPLMQHAVEAHAELEADLRGALPNRELQLYYQIQVDGEHRPIGAEALIRWTHPQRGMVSPAHFIPVAEESSLILDIGHWVIETACQQLTEWERDEQMRHLILAINVSARQFQMPDFVERLEEVIVRHGIVPDRLKLELTESVVLEDVAGVVSEMYALKALGVRLSLDDFGTGYSSLAYLKQLPLDQIKIDQSFVRDITTDPNDAVMVKTIIDMAQNFRLNVIAEGVETEAQLAFLKQNDCMAYQGYLFSKPVPVVEFEALARRLFG